MIHLIVSNAGQEDIGLSCAIEGPNTEEGIEAGAAALWGLFAVLDDSPAGYGGTLADFILDVAKRAKEEWEEHLDAKEGDRDFESSWQNWPEKDSEYDPPKTEGTVFRFGNLNN